MFTLFYIIAMTEQPYTNANFILAPQITYSVPDFSKGSFATNGNFRDSANLWFYSGRKPRDKYITEASFTFYSQIDNAPTMDGLVVNRNTDTRSYPSTVTAADKAAHYSFFTNGNFSATLNLTPYFPNQQANMPSHIIPSMSGSLNF